MSIKHVFVIMVAVLNFIALRAYAYDDQITHREITKIALEDSNLANTLTNQFGITNPLDKKYKNKTISQLIRDGSENEDDNFSGDNLDNWFRAFNHFYNPIHNEGLHDVGCGWFFNTDNIWSNCFWFCWSFTGRANPEWALGEADYTNHYSLRLAKQEYYEALISTSEEERDKKFANFYEKFGRVLHCLQDMGVPAHTRNDMFGHLDFTKIEISLPFEWMGNSYEFWVKQKMQKESSYILSTWQNSQNIIIPKFELDIDYWDKQIYTGGNPAYTIPENGVERCGLSEYTNANFLSKYGMFNEMLPFGDDHYFPYPAKSSVAIMPPEPITAEDGNIDEVKYLKKDKDGEIIEKLACVRYFWSDINIIELENYYRLAFSLDDSVHESYAKKLIPKTIAYTTGLINYFFRGRLDINLPSNAKEIILNNPEQSDRILTIDAKNTTENNQEMTGGSIKLVIRYKDNGANYYEVVSAQSGIMAISYSDTELHFDLSEISIPSTASEIFIQIVYFGHIGQETGIAVGGKQLFKIIWQENWDGPDFTSNNPWDYKCWYLKPQLSDWCYEFGCNDEGYLDESKLTLNLNIDMPQGIEEGNKMSGINLDFDIPKEIRKIKWKINAEYSGHCGHDQIIIYIFDENTQRGHYFALDYAPGMEDWYYDFDEHFEWDNTWEWDLKGSQPANGSEFELDLSNKFAAPPLVSKLHFSATLGACAHSLDLEWDYIQFE